MSSKTYLNHCEEVIAKAEDKIIQTVHHKKLLGEHRIINEKLDHFIKVRSIYSRIRDRITRDQEGF